MSIFVKLLTLLTVFAVGFVVRLFGLLDKASTKKLFAFVTNVCYPLLTVSAFTTTKPAASLQLMGTVLVISLVLMLIPAFICLFLFGSSKRTEAAALRFCTVFQSCGFLGLPLLTLAYGSNGAFYGACFVLFSQIYVRTVGVFLLKSATGKGFGTYLKTLFDPALIGALVGAFMLVANVKPAGFIGAAINTVGDMALPLMAVVLGSMLRDIEPKQVFLSADVYVSAVIKLVALPFAALIGCSIFGISEGTTYLVVLTAALPTTVWAYPLAEAFGASRVKALACTELTTILSVFTIPFVLYIAKLTF